jgi:hypothetical protein
LFLINSISSDLMRIQGSVQMSEPAMEMANGKFGFFLSLCMGYLLIAGRVFPSPDISSENGWVDISIAFRLQLGANSKAMAI